MHGLSFGSVFSTNRINLLIAAIQITSSISTSLEFEPRYFHCQAAGIGGQGPSGNSHLSLILFTYIALQLHLKLQL